jgi:hypothetical protein
LFVITHILAVVEGGIIQNGGFEQTGGWSFTPNPLYGDDYPLQGAYPANIQNIV